MKHVALPVLLGCVILSVGCTERGDLNEPSGFQIDPRLFSGTDAFTEVEDFVDLGPRVSGTEGAAEAAEYLAERFKDLGLEVEIDAFDDPSPRGPVTFRNVMAQISGSGPGIILIGSHYDTKHGISDDFIGANDSGSSTGIQLALARIAAGAAAQAPPPKTLLFVAFDGEECYRRYGHEDGFHGSRHLAEEWESSGVLEEVEAVVVIDMVGDSDLNVTIPRNGDYNLMRLAFQCASSLGCREHFELVDSNIGDDHVAFLERGVPAIDLIDFKFGSAPGLNDYWHTTEDTMDKLSPESLEIIGRILACMINGLMQTGI